MLDLSNSHFDDQLILEETQTIILTASETTALTVSTVLVVLGILQQVEVFLFSKSKRNTKMFITGKNTLWTFWGIWER